MNVHRHDEPAPNDAIYSDTLLIYGGSSCAQLFVGTKSLVSNLYGMKRGKHFVNSLEDTIGARGKMSKIISDGDQAEISDHAQSPEFTKKPET